MIPRSHNLIRDAKVEKVSTTVLHPNVSLWLITEKLMSKGQFMNMFWELGQKSCPGTGWDGTKNLWMAKCEQKSVVNNSTKRTGAVHLSTQKGWQWTKWMGNGLAVRGPSCVGRAWAMCEDNEAFCVNCARTMANTGEWTTCAALWTWTVLNSIQKWIGQGWEVMEIVGFRMAGNEIMEDTQSCWFLSFWYNK